MADMQDFLYDVKVKEKIKNDVWVKIYWISDNSMLFTLYIKDQLQECDMYIRIDYENVIYYIYNNRVIDLDGKWYI